MYPLLLARDGHARRGWRERGHGYGQGGRVLQPWLPAGAPRVRSLPPRLARRYGDDGRGRGVVRMTVVRRVIVWTASAAAAILAGVSRCTFSGIGGRVGEEARAAAGRAEIVGLARVLAVCLAPALVTLMPMGSIAVPVTSTPAGTASSWSQWQTEPSAW